ncbi:MAG: hypothetical protein H0U76_07930, partial [Ktedonobacteraceae bacterium]|nr:hypothetical protein [Ktedonobacteraceae bacterium]
MTDKYSKETEQKRIVQAFKALLAQEDIQIDLSQAALLIARIEYPDLNQTQALIYLDELARRVRTLLALPEPEISLQLPDDIKPLVVIDALNKVLFDEQGFHGDHDDYYNPDNSFLNKVLERRTGIPITLSLLYIEVGRRVGIQIDGIGFPYHFMVRHRWDQSVIYIDPFGGGTLLTEKDCEEHLRRIARQRIRLHPQWFKPITHRHM